MNLSELQDFLVKFRQNTFAIGNIPYVMALVSIGENTYLQVQFPGSRRRTFNIYKGENIFEVQEFSTKRGFLGCSFGDEKHVLKEILKTWVDMM